MGNSYRLEDCVLVSYPSIWDERKIDGSMAVIYDSTGLTYSHDTPCNEGAMNWHRACVANKWKTSLRDVYGVMILSEEIESLRTCNECVPLHQLNTGTDFKSLYATA